MLFILPLAFAAPFTTLNQLSSVSLTVFLICFLGVVIFECINGFHDTANAVATVIYTNTLKPAVAIVWSGLWNFLGVFIIGTAVAMSLLKLVPLDRLITLPTAIGTCLVGAILLASIIWNLGTWYFGLPLSSTHTLIGAMIGASLSFSYYYGGAVNWSKAGEIGLSLLISPIIGFAGAALLMYAVKHLIKSDELQHTPQNDDDKPPMPVRALLVTTCTMVNFFHGSNDGQKGVGLLMLVLIIFLPASFAFNPKISNQQMDKALQGTQQVLQQLSVTANATRPKITQLEAQLTQVAQQADGKKANGVQQKFRFRKQLQQLTDALKDFAKHNQKQMPENLKKQLSGDIKVLENTTGYAPVWVLLVISLSLGVGTTIGWKRIVVTIGERIGNETLNYAEGASAELVAATTIGLSTALGLPVSTTHVLSSGVAGAMTASNGAKNLNYSTVRSIILAWVLTLPAAIVLSALLFALFHLFV